MACPVVESGEASPWLGRAGGDALGPHATRCAGGTSTGPRASGHQPLEEGGGRVTCAGLRAPFSERHHRLASLSMISCATLGMPRGLPGGQQRQCGL